MSHFKLVAQVQDNVVIDTHSHLMWTLCLLGATWNGITCEGKAASYGWQQAQELAKNSTLADKETAVPMVKIPNINQAVFPTPNCQGAKRTASHHDGHSCWQWVVNPNKRQSTLYLDC